MTDKTLAPLIREAAAALDCHRTHCPHGDNAETIAERAEPCKLPSGCRNEQAERLRRFAGALTEEQTHEG